MGSLDGAAAAIGALRELTGRTPYKWQERLLCRWFVEGRIPDTVDIPTGLGKTTAIALWLAALSGKARLPRRLIYVVDRRAVVDQASAEADKLADALGDAEEGNTAINELRRGLGLKPGQPLPVSTLRGQRLDNRRWLEDPGAPAIIIGTVDMIGSRLLFEGYGVSPRMRPVHAGLLGADALVMLDEAHLVPPFAALLRSVAEMSKVRQVRDLDPSLERLLVFHLMTLSATGREDRADRCTHASFELEPEDRSEERVRARLDAAKHLLLHDLPQGADLAETMAERAFELGGGGKRVLVFCNSRRAAQKVCDGLAKKRLPVELFAGARRVHEREKLSCSPVFQRFDPNATHEGSNEQPAFLVATSAGEVGVDLDADHMVCDLVPWERMVQRLGRVNRRGDFAGHVALIDVFAAKPDKDAEDGAEDADKLALWRKPFNSPAWPEKEERLDASAGTLHRLKADPELLNIDPELKFRLEQAISEEPLRPALTKPLLEAWSMTSLAEHPGRPEAEPWLRGWVKDEPQTRIVWRTHLPVRVNRYGEPLPDREVRTFFEAAPPHLSEVLETRTREEVVPWLVDRAAAAVKRAAPAETPTAQDDAAGGREERGAALVEPSLAASPVRRLDSKEIVAFLLSSAGIYERCYTLEGLADRSSRRELERDLPGRTLVIDARLGGLDAAGLLSGKAETPPPTLDGKADPKAGWTDDQLKAIGFRVCRDVSDDSPGDKWRIA
jgi:CRISPR-associated endonuclease/helicase Cas3